MRPTCVIVDDDELMVDKFTGYLQGIKEIELAGAYTDSVVALKNLVKTPPDILILDIQMPQLSGLDIVRALPTLPYIIFITSSLDFAVESYALNVADYLVKPVYIDRFKQAVDKAVKSIKAHSVLDENDALLKIDNYTFIKIDSKYTRLNFDDIIYIEAEKNFTRIYTIDQVLISSVNMKTFEETLPLTHFIRTHRSYMLNLNHIQSIEADVINTPKGQVPLGITYKDSVLEKTIGRRLIR